MTSAVYGLGRQAFGDADIDWSANNIKAVLVDAEEYTPSIDVDNALDDVTAGGRIATSGNFASKTNVLGVFDADDITWTTVTGDEAEYIVIYYDTGTESTSLLIALIDDATGLPVTPGGGDITVRWDSGANKILKL